MPELDERIAVVEAEARHMRQQLAEVSVKVNDVHQIITALKGVRWALIAVATVAGFVAGKFGTFLALFAGKP